MTTITGVASANAMLLSARPQSTTGTPGPDTSKVTPFVISIPEDKVDLSALAASDLVAARSADAETRRAQSAKHLADSLAASAERNAKSQRIKELADQIYAEVHRLKDAYVEPPAFAVISDERGKVVGKVLQGGGIWFDSDEIWRVKDNAALQLLSDKVWKRTDDPKQAQQRLYEGLKELVGTRGMVTLTGFNVDPPPFGSELLTSLQEEFYSLLNSGS